MSQTKVSLAQQKKRGIFTLMSIEGNEIVKQRLLQMGLVEGDRFSLEHRMMIVNMFVIQFGNMRIALRKKEAECLIVNPVLS